MGLSKAQAPLASLALLQPGQQICPPSWRGAPPKKKKTAATKAQNPDAPRSVPDPQVLGVARVLVAPQRGMGVQRVAGVVLKRRLGSGA